MEGIRYWIETEGTGHWFFIAFPVVLVCLFIWFKGSRVRFLIPSLLISLVIVNPVFYKYWDKLGLYAYWRILWIVPVIPILAAVAPSISERIQKPMVKAVVTGACLGLVLLGGTFLYNGAGGSFVEAANAAKLPEKVVAIADRLLELKERPRVIAQDPIGVYIRQYSGQIDTLFGRDIHGFMTGTMSAEAVTAISDINNPESDLSQVCRIMLDNGYDYAVLQSSGKQVDSLQLIEQIGDYGIYEPIGNPSVIKERDELGRVISVTTLDAYGNPTNNEVGYSTVHYAFDERNNITCEFHSDVLGNGVLDASGKAGYIKEYNASDQMVGYSSIGENYELKDTYLGFSEIRTEYIDNKLKSESYLNQDCELTNNINGYAREEREYDNAGNIIVQRYFNQDGDPVVSASGYAEKRCGYNSKGQLTYEAYYDPQGVPIIQEAGYVAIEQKWEGERLISRTYLNDSGQPVNRIDGYSTVQWVVDENGTRETHFFDIYGNEIEESRANYAMLDIHFGEDGWSEWITPDCNKENICFYVGTANMNKKSSGDQYSCQVEIEFKNVQCTPGKSFHFFSQGPVDGNWSIRNVWDASIIWIESPPSDGQYVFSNTQIIDENTAKASVFEIGFRCDNWACGSFRIRHLIISEGQQEIEWIPGM